MFAVSLVGIATPYWMDGQGIESRWRRDFSHPSRRALGPTQSSIKCVPGIKRLWRGVNHSPPPKAEVKEREELYLYSPSGPS
jgi:hypothetical protein